jgi:signal transduction histidine kinase
MALRSLRSRILIGALLWTGGLVAVSHIILTALNRYNALLVAHNTLLLTSAVLCLIGGLAQVRRSLAPFDDLRARLAAVREGRQRHVDGTYPAEVQPLVTDLNALLDHRDQTIARAQSTAGNLAHGLKTPLAVLSQDADQAASDGHPSLATSIRQQVDKMRRQVDYHLAHARVAASGATPGAHCAVSESAEGLARTLRRLYAGRGVEIVIETSADHHVRVQREDLDEIIGNLLDNACKWARSRVTLRSAEANGALTITVDDDGPGLPDSMRDAVLQRGVRVDEGAPGSGLGLAIVADFVELYGGSITLAASPAGGLRARLTLQAVDGPRPRAQGQ